MRRKPQLTSEAFLCSLFVVLTSANTLAQLVSYPLHTGDEWEYSGFVPNAPGRVTTDTLMPNGRTYRIITSQGYPVGYPTFFWQYHRQEANKVFSYNSSTQNEFVLFDFDAAQGDTFSRYSNQLGGGKVILLAKTMDTLFGVPRRRWTFYHDLAEYVIDEEIKLEVTDTLGITGFFNIFGYGGRISGARINGKSYGIITTVPIEASSYITSFQLDPPFPNPFNPTTNIHLAVKRTEYISLKVYDLLGREISTISSGILAPGEYLFQWTAGSFPSAFYLIHAESKTFTQSHGIFLLK